MAPLILVMMVVVPIIEIGLFIQVGGWLGLFPTLGVVILTAVTGTWLLRQQGLSTLARVQENLEAGRLPVAEVFDGVCLLMAGALLLTPGFFTDAVGFLLFVAPVRRWAMARIADHLVRTGRVHVQGGPAGRGMGAGTRPSDGTQGPQPPGTGPIIDGEYQDVTPEREPGPEGARDAAEKLPPKD